MKCLGNEPRTYDTLIKSTSEATMISMSFSLLDLKTPMVVVVLSSKAKETKNERERNQTCTEHCMRTVWKRYQTQKHKDAMF